MKTPLKPRPGPRPRPPSLKTRRAQLDMAVTLLVLIMTTLLLCRFGFADFSHALTFPGRLTGAVLIMFAFTTLLGVVAVLDHWIRHSFQYSGLVALVGALAAFLPNALLCLRTLKNGDSLFFPVLFGALAAGAAWAVFSVWRTLAAVPAPKRVAAALIVSTLFAVANFGYQNLYLPYRRVTRPLITLAVGKPVPSKDGKAFAVPVDITLQNQADVGFYVLGTEFHAMGQRVPLSPKDRLREQWRSDAERWANSSGEVNPLSRREIHQAGQLVEAKPWMFPGDWIESSDAFTTRVVVQLPMNTPYDQLAFYATASLARKDQIVLDPPLRFVTTSWKGGNVAAWVKKQKGDALVYQARVHENNAIDENTRDPRFVTVYWRFGTQGAAVQSSVARMGEESRLRLSGEETRELVSRYGLVDLAAGPVERTLWDIKSQR
ncbi:hypothetical protein ABZ915_39795 [Streptomyces sp. NPDC046915]|uniref:hypothetical protein n=1 Tax=Streptomyces sp. NPDC046915 TaxID=3155257 RepID=UPI0033D44419